MTELSFLAPVLIFLLAAVVIAPVFQRLRASLVLGYLVAGVVIGPHGLDLVEESAATRDLGDLGVVFLLFTIGLELGIDRLRVFRGYIFGLGGAQVLATGALIAAVGRAAGLPFEAAVVVGGALALSSTAVLLQMLSERGELATRVGRIALAVLLMQDLAVVPLLALVPAFAGIGADSPIVTVGLTFLEAGVAVVAIFYLGRRVVRPLFRLVAGGRSPETFAALTLLVLLGSGWLTASLGLSFAMGGFLAGVLLAETEYRHEVAADIGPFRGVFLGLFFMTVGMGLDVRMVATNAAVVVAIVFGLVVGKACVLAVLCRIAGLKWGPSSHIGLLLGPGGEFGFIILGLAAALDVVPVDLATLLVVAIAVTMALTPGLGALGRWAQRAVERAGSAGVAALGRETEVLRDHVVLAGFGRVGQSIAKALEAAEIAWVAIEFDPARASEAHQRGLPVFYGDASRPDVLRAAGVDRARAAVVTLDRPELAERCVGLLHQSYPALEIFVRARDTEHHDKLAHAGASSVVHETYELSLQLADNILRRLGLGEDRVGAIMREHRAAGYARLDDIIAKGGKAKDTATKGRPTP